MSDYLPKDATIEQTCKWLEASTGETWILPRLLECHLTPYFWLDYKPGYPVIFGDRVEGYLARMMSHGDKYRLESDGADALVNKYAAHDGALITSVPGIRVPLSNLRFKRDRVQRVAEIINASKQADTQPQAAPALTADTEPAPVVQVSESEPGNWKMKIQAEAAARFIRLRAVGASPTAHSILDDMVKWCRANDVKTDGGVYPKAGYLRTHVLGGRHWTPPR